MCAALLNVSKMALNVSQFSFRILRLTISYMSSGSLKDLGKQETVNI